LEEPDRILNNWPAPHMLPDIPIIVWKLLFIYLFYYIFFFFVTLGPITQLCCRQSNARCNHWNSVLQCSTKFWEIMSPTSISCSEGDHSETLGQCRWNRHLLCLHSEVQDPTVVWNSFLFHFHNRFYNWYYTCKTQKYRFICQIFNEM